LRYLREIPDRPPLFLYVHLLYAHAPYEPPPGFRGALADEARAAGLLDSRRIAYEEEILGMDALIGELFQGLRERSRPGQLVLHVVADHGEAFGEHGQKDHGTTLYNELLRIPWIVLAPGVAGGRRVPEVVSSVDVFPTILEQAGVEPEPDLPGRSVVPLLRGEAYEARPVLSEFSLHPSFLHLVALQDATRKVVAGPNGAVAAFDLADDPDELVNLLASEGGATPPDRVPAEFRALAASADSWIRSRAGKRIVAEETPDAETLETLRELGYGGESLEDEADGSQEGPAGEPPEDGADGSPEGGADADSAESPSEPPR
jgi:arylsulfatase A-like enzyme